MLIYHQAKQTDKTGKMTQWIKVLVAKPYHLHSNPGTHRIEGMK